MFCPMGNFFDPDYFAGLECARLSWPTSCVDIDECLDPRPWASATQYCGADTACQNTVEIFEIPRPK